MTQKFTTYRASMKCDAHEASSSSSRLPNAIAAALAGYCTLAGASPARVAIDVCENIAEALPELQAAAFASELRKLAEHFESH